MLGAIVDEAEVVGFDHDEAELNSLATAFAKDGYLRIPRIADPAEVAFIRTRLDEMWASKTGFDQGYQFDLVGDDDENKVLAFPQIIHPSMFAPELLKTDFFAHAQILARALLGPEAKFSSDHALLKKPLVGPETPWHQDQGFRDPAFDYHEVSIWLALQPTDMQNGCMQFMAGSQEWGPLPHQSLNGNAKVHAMECIGEFDRADAISCPLPAGGCTVHGGLTLHSAGPNYSTRARAAWVLIFELPPRPSATVRAGTGVSRVTARAERERRWKRHGGALVVLRRHISRTNLRDPRQLMVLLRVVASGGFRMIRGSNGNPDRNPLPGRDD